VKTICGNCLHRPDLKSGWLIWLHYWSLQDGAPWRRILVLYWLQHKGVTCQCCWGKQNFQSNVLISPTSKIILTSQQTAFTPTTIYPIHPRWLRCRTTCFQVLWGLHSELVGTTLLDHCSSAQLQDPKVTGQTHCCASTLFELRRAAHKEQEQMLSGQPKANKCVIYGQNAWRGLGAR
jgi:hypothetical protein